MTLHSLVLRVSGGDATGRVILRSTLPVRKILSCSFSIHGHTTTSQNKREEEEGELHSAKLVFPVSGSQELFISTSVVALRDHIAFSYFVAISILQFLLYSASVILVVWISNSATPGIWNRGYFETFFIPPGAKLIRNSLSVIVESCCLKIKWHSHLSLKNQSEWIRLIIISTARFFCHSLLGIKVWKVRIQTQFRQPKLPYRELSHFRGYTWNAYVDEEVLVYPLHN